MRPRRPAPAPDRPAAGEQPGPDLTDLTPQRSLRHLELQVTRRLDGLLHGQHLGLLPGPGTELAEARTYQPGEDDVRHMDWAVTARTTVPHVRDLITDHELQAWALVDLTASMEFGTTELQKRDLAIAALAAVGFLTVRLGDRIGAYLLTSAAEPRTHPAILRRIPARTGRPAFHAMLRTLLATGRTASRGAKASTARPAGPSPAGATTVPGAVTFADAITSLDRGQTRRGLRVVISDFLDPAATHPAPARPAWEEPLRRLAARHQVLAIEIIDPRELDLPDIGVVHLADPETGATAEIALTPRVREAYAGAAAAQRELTRQALRRAGAAHLILRTDRDWIADIARFAVRQRRVTGRRGRATPTTPRNGQGAGK